MDLINIAKSWYAYAEGNFETKNRMARRLAICDTCEHKKQLSPIGKAIIGNSNEPNSIYKCGKCSCPLVALSAGKNSKCEKWGNDSEDFY